MENVVTGVARHSGRVGMERDSHSGKAGMAWLGPSLSLCQNCCVRDLGVLANQLEDVRVNGNRNSLVTLFFCQWYWKGLGVCE